MTGDMRQTLSTFAGQPNAILGLVLCVQVSADSSSVLCLVTTGGTQYPVTLTFSSQISGQRGAWQSGCKQGEVCW